MGKLLKEPDQTFVGTKFHGDGRKRVDPDFYVPHTKATSLTRSRARAIINMFLDRKSSAHSAAGSTMWVIFSYCKDKQLTVKHHPESYYFLMLMEEEKL